VPSWLTLVSPALGVVQTAGITPGQLSSGHQITVSAPVNTVYDGHSGYIVITSDDGKIEKRIRVEQSTPAPNNPTAIVYNNVNAEITWDGIGCIIYEIPVSECDISIVGSGDFETDPLLNNWTILTNKEGSGWQWDDSNLPSYYMQPHTGAYSMSSYSWTGSAVDVDNWLITPKVKVTTDYHILKFWVESIYVDRDGDNYEVLVSTTGTDVADFTSFRASTPAQYASYEEISVDLTDYIGQEIYIALRHEDYDENALYLDDVSGLELAGCTAASVSLNSGVVKSPQLSLKNATFSKRKLRNESKSIAADAQSETQTSLQLQAISLKDAVENGLISKEDIKNNVQAQTLPVVQAQSAPSIVAQSIPFELKHCGSPAYIISGYTASANQFKAKEVFNESDLAQFATCGSTLKSVTLVVGTAKVINLQITKNGTVVYTHPSTVSLTAQALTTITLSTPVDLTGATELEIIYTITSAVTSSQYPIVTDGGPSVGGTYYSTNGGTTWSLFTLNYNMYIVGNVEFNGAVGYYKLYRQRKVNGVEVGAPRSFKVTDTVYNDEDIIPGGEYCYWLAFVSGGAESCAGDTSCVFIMYQQTIERTTPIEKTYGDADFKIDHAATDGYIIRSTVEDIDYFAGRTIPVKLAPYDGNVAAITLTGVESNYNVSINTAGSLRLAATQEGIPDTLLPAPAVPLTINISKKDLIITADNKSRQEGQDNPIFTFSYDSYITGEDVSYLDVPPTATCVAGRLSPVGEYKIAVNVGLDKNYNLIPVSGILTVERYTERVNAFTPYDNDDFNDTFMPSYKIKVYNRYGVLIYETKNKQQETQGWDGRFQNTNKLVNPGVYYYVVVDDNGKVTRKGSVNVVKK
jgi:hypothetical protein